MTRRIVVHVDRLVVHGLDLTDAERAGLEEAFRAELSRLLADEPGRDWASATTAVLRPGSRPLPDGGGGVLRLGTAVARSVYAGLPGAGTGRGT